MNPKEMTDEELANILDTLCITGISPTWLEKAVLREAAERLRRENQEDGN